MSALYTSAKNKLLGGVSAGGATMDVDTEVMKLRLVNVTGDYVFSAADTVMTPVTKYLSTTDQTLTVTVAGGVVDAGDPTYTGVAADGTKTVGALVMFKFVTNDAGSFPLAYIDGFTPTLPNGGNITVQFDNGANKIFSL